ncbi:histidine kinase [Duganella sp. LX20W]|uniref:Histidine kinase n=1 Tax=Rugamonas brunnea TaxID=2758569 RepID=A0A7W2ESM5_9BURK|nr:sensor histidine kinase [Rugamonas brunnea]MBA5637897.1 histidine kinase [Rugamonas brunnea]
MPSSPARPARPVPLRLLALALLLLTAAGAPAATPRPRLLDDYTHTAWGALDDAPVDVLKFAQTADGWLWLSTATGLFRFDGQHYERVDAIDGQPLLSSNVLALCAPPEGGLWVGYRFGGISHFHQGRVRHYGLAEGVPGGAVMSITRAPDGVLWAATRDGFTRLLGERFVPAGAELGLPTRGARQILFDHDGTQWMSVQGNVYFRKAGAARFLPAWPRLDLMGMALAPDGTVWASDAIDSYYRMRTSAPPPGQAARPELPGSGMEFDRAGDMWLMRADSVQRRQPGQPLAPGQELTPDHGLSGGLPQTFFQDREDNIWIGTSAGVDRFRRNRLVALPVAGDFDHAAMAPAGAGAIWVSDHAGPVRQLGTDGVRRVALRRHGWTVYRDPNGVLWLGNESGLWRQHGNDGVLIPYPAALRGYDSQALSRADGGGLWVSVARAGLYLLRDGRWQKDGGLPGLPADYPLCLTREAGGAVWAGYGGNQIARIAGGRVDRYGPAQGVALGVVLSLFHRDGQLWAGGERGVAWFDGSRFVPLRGQDGQEFAGVSGIVRTAAGDLWLFGADGLTHIGAAALAAAMRAPAQGAAYERFDAHDGLVGMPSQLRPLPSLIEADDGRLWLSTANKVSWIDPARIARNTRAPTVQVRALVADGRHYAPRPDLTLPVRTRALRIDFTALSLGMPERVRFRYRLDGFDHAWQDPGQRRQAFYTNLAPGAYRFRVLAANEDGVWSERSAQQSFRIPPTFTQTPWFIVLCLAAAALLLYGLYRLRMRQVTRQLRQRMQARLDERERIARALHDTFLQSVQGLVLRFQTLLKRLPDDDARALAERILDQADDVMAEGRQQLTGLRTAALHDGDLQRSLAAFGQALEQEQHERPACAHEAGRPARRGPRFTLEALGAHRPLAEPATEQAYHIAREALLNAFQHAQADNVAVELTYDVDHFLLQVRDDGRGMDQQVLQAGQRPGHWGLTGMRERARQLDGTVALWSAPGKGTEIRLKLPAARAYAGAPARTWRQRLGAWLGRTGGGG